MDAILSFFVLGLVLLCLTWGYWKQFLFIETKKKGQSGAKYIKFVYKHTT